MALSRGELKLIVKECIIELLSEGLGNVQAAVARPPQARNPLLNGTVREGRTANGRRKPDYDPRLDTPLGNGRQATDALKEAIKRESGGSSVMANILADTAMTTLPAMIQGEGPGGGGGFGIQPGAQQEKFHGTPDEVFGDGGAQRADGSSHWADLAFAPGKKPA